MPKRGSTNIPPGVIGCGAIIVLFTALFSTCLPTDGSGTPQPSPPPDEAQIFRAERIKKFTPTDNGILQGDNVIVIDFADGYTFGMLPGRETHQFTDRKNTEGFRNLWRAGQMERVKKGTVGHVLVVGEEDASMPINRWATVDFGTNNGVNNTVLKIPTYMLTPTSRNIPGESTREYGDRIRAKSEQMLKKQER